MVQTHVDRGVLACTANLIWIDMFLRLALWLNVPSSGNERRESKFISWDLETSSLNEQARDISNLNDQPQYKRTEFQSFSFSMENPRPFYLYVFGDQTYDIQTTDLRSLVHDGKDNPVVVDFLERARRALRDSLNHLRPEDRQHAPPFASVSDMLLWKGGNCVPIDMAMLCLYQLGSFMKCVARSPTNLLPFSSHFRKQN